MPDIRNPLIGKVSLIGSIPSFAVNDKIVVAGNRKHSSRSVVEPTPAKPAANSLILPETESVYRMRFLCLPFIALFAFTFGSNSSTIVGQDLYQNYADPDRSAVCPNCNHRLPRVNVCGWKGHPWRDKELGGCRCGKKSPLTFYNFDCHWPAPFSVVLDHGCSGRARRATTDTTQPRLRDCLDCLADFRLLPPVRRDNGHTGPGCDPFGYVGRSRQGQIVMESVEPQLIPETIPPAPADAPAAKDMIWSTPVTNPVDQQREKATAAARLWESHPTAGVPVVSQPVLIRKPLLPEPTVKFSAAAPQGNILHDQPPRMPQPPRMAEASPVVWDSRPSEREIDDTMQR